nr:A15 [uncultured bacterium]
MRIGEFFGNPESKRYAGSESHFWPFRSTLPVKRLLVCTIAVLATNQVALARSRDTVPLLTYQRESQALVDSLLPALSDASGQSGKPAAFRLSVLVTASQNPLQLEVNRQVDGALKLEISAAFFVFLDVLTDSVIVGDLAHRGSDVFTYADEVLAAARASTSTENSTPLPLPYFRRVGWSQSQYNAVFQSAAYAERRRNLHIQSIVWLLAHRFSSLPDTGAPSQTSTDSRSAEWVARAGYAPLPIPGVAMLYAVATDPATRDARQWRCRARQIETAGVDVLVRDRSVEPALSVSVSPAFIERWRALIEKVATAEDCAQLMP